jgi:hypothetical protein
MNGNSLGVVLSSGGLAAAAKCSGSQSGRDSLAASRPDLEVVAKANWLTKQRLASLRRIER